MAKEIRIQKELEEGGLEGPSIPLSEKMDIINIDNPEGTSSVFMGENFDSIVAIYKLLNNPDPNQADKVRIDYAEDDRGNKTATVFVDSKKYYFTDSIREIDSFHSWQENKDKRAQKKRKLN
ncbi:MAG: hypothetical protein A2649_04150 [Candidatus Yanofskybacteria bacterium RIFCSPHIGHO2_01_FULL_41_26]|uniref:Uncharacterized protein n=1 Tax=Candidatus Yanofskybacteria bacterium RIFCSPHIGHO2_01_FULL_41_26 TaxID=1802661 RepID=A0A1F8EBZ2_9BACT|nr:MAG: hypothetical protein A2649_04150 [Candidatus Yanofskybacteria bacterium RIFCSPHIGHO2_01_FULL_41_26]